MEASREHYQRCNKECRQNELWNERSKYQHQQPEQQCQQQTHQWKIFTANHETRRDFILLEELRTPRHRQYGEELHCCRELRILAQKHTPQARKTILPTIHLTSFLPAETGLLPGCSTRVEP